MSRLVIYFSIHPPTYPEPLRTETFLINFSACDIFIMENTEQWLTECPELESQYNCLSNGGIGVIIPQKVMGEIENMLPNEPPNEFQKQLEATIHCRERSIILERTPVPYLKVEDFPRELQNALKTGLEEAVKCCKLQLREWAANMNQRDDTLLDLICEQLKGNAKVFVFWGAAHEKYLSKLLNEKKISFIPERFCSPMLEERVLFPLTIGEQLDETDVLRWLYVQVTRQNGDFEKVRTLMEKADAMDKKQLRFELTALSDRIKLEGIN